MLYNSNKGETIELIFIAYELHYYKKINKVREI